MNLQNTPLVTVAMVTYNSSKYVRMAIESVLASSYINFELIISDDCSTDNTWEIINEYKDQRIRTYRNETNIGEYTNRNSCIDLAKGKYLLYVDGDDYIYPHALEFMVKYMEEYPNSVMGLSRPYDPRYIYPKELFPKETISSQFFGKSVLNQSLARNIFTTEVLKREGKFSTKHIAGDYHMRLKIGSKYPILLFIDGLIWWRQHPGQATSYLTNGDLGITESFHIDIEFLKNNSHHIEGFNKKKAISERKKKLVPLILRRFIKFQVFKAYRLFKLILK